MKKGLVHIYHGDGKGKTTASMGLALRAAAAGLNVYIAQFLKGSPSGEVTLLEKLPNVRVERGAPGLKFSWQMTDEEKAAARADGDARLAEAVRAAEKDACGLVVLDEAIGACACGLLDEAALVRFMREKPAGMELVVTGRGPTPAMCDAADYITEMVKQKHPFDEGVDARHGIEY